MERNIDSLPEPGPSASSPGSAAITSRSDPRHDSYDQSGEGRAGPWLWRSIRLGRRVYSLSKLEHTVKAAKMLTCLPDLGPCGARQVPRDVAVGAKVLFLVTFTSRDGLLSTRSSLHLVELPGK